MSAKEKEQLDSAVLQRDTTVINVGIDSTMDIDETATTTPLTKDSTDTPVEVVPLIVIKDCPGNGKENDANNQEPGLASGTTCESPASPTNESTSRPTPGCTTLLSPGPTPGGEHRVPCRARGMPSGHDAACVIIPEGAVHGDKVCCSDPACSKNGKKYFRYCSFCKEPKSASRFDFRHRHGNDPMRSLPLPPGNSSSQAKKTATATNKKAKNKKKRPQRDQSGQSRRRQKVGEIGGKLKVVDHRRWKGIDEFKIRWNGKPPSQDTWELSRSLCETSRKAAKLFLKQKEADKRRMDEAERFLGIRSKLPSVVQGFEFTHDKQLLASHQSRFPHFFKKPSKQRPQPNAQEIQEMVQRAKKAKEMEYYNFSFKPVERINVNEPDAKERVTHARIFGIPIVLTGHKGWPQFAERWLKSKNDAPSPEPTSGPSSDPTPDYTPGLFPGPTDDTASPTTDDTARQTTGYAPDPTLGPTTGDTSGSTTGCTLGPTTGDTSGPSTGKSTDSMPVPTTDAVPKPTPGLQPAVATLPTSSLGDTGVKDLEPRSGHKPDPTSSSTATQEASGPVSMATPVVVDTTNQAAEFDINKTNNDESFDHAPDSYGLSLLDLSQPHEVDVQKMISDIGHEEVPILKKNYNERKPNFATWSVGRYLENCWPSSKNQGGAGLEGDADSLYLHQWQFPLSDTAVGKLCGPGKCEPLPNNILEEDLMPFFQEHLKDNPFQYIFMGNANTMSKFHKDNGGLMITIAPMVGEKECVLGHRDDGKSCLYDLESKLEDFNLDKFPMTLFSRVWKTVIKPGEILIMPQGTYHQCRNVTPCLSYHR